MTAESRCVQAPRAVLERIQEAYHRSRAVTASMAVDSVGRRVSRRLPSRKDPSCLRN